MNCPTTSQLVCCRAIYRTSETGDHEGLPYYELPLSLDGTEHPSGCSCRGFWIRKLNEH